MSIYRFQGAMAAIALTVTLGSVASAQPVAGSALGALMGSIETDQHALADAREKQDQMVTENAKDKQVFDSYAGSERALRTQEEQMSAPVLADLNRRLASANGIVDNYNGECSPDRVGALPPGPFQRCVSLKQQVVVTIGAIRHQVDVDRQTFIDQKIAPIERVRASQNAAMDVIRNRMNQRFAAWQSFKDTGDALERRIAQSRAALVAACANADARAATSPQDTSALEAMHYCHSIGWDGASRSLPPLTTIRKPFAATPNH